MRRAISFGVLAVVLASFTACRSAESGAAGVRERLNGYPALGWSDSKMDRFGAKVCGQFPNGVWGDPRVSGSASSPGYSAYVGDPKPQWITWMAPWIWQDFFDVYCSNG